MEKFIRFFREDWLFTLSLLLAGVSIWFGEFVWQDIDIKTISSLLGLMAAVKFLERIGVIGNLAKRLTDLSSTTRSLAGNLTFLSFFSSMLLSKEAAVLTLLPVFFHTAGKNKKSSDLTLSSVLIILAANLGSSLLPYANPQNLFLFSYYDLKIDTFLAWMKPFFLLSIAVLVLLLMKVPSSPLKRSRKKTKKIKGKSLLQALFALFLMSLSLFGFIPYWVAVPVVLLLLRHADRQILKKLDYRLLLTFVFFFIIMGNFSRTEFLRSLLPFFSQSPFWNLIGSSLLSQFSSTAPAAMLVAPFSYQVKPLLWGVNIGGMGTMAASLSNLIGFKLFSSYQPHLKKGFLKKFSVVNFSLLLFYLAVFSFLINT